MKKLIKSSESEAMKITIEAYGCGDPCTCPCIKELIADGEPGGSSSPDMNK